MILFKKWTGLSNLLSSSGGEALNDNEQPWLLLAQQGNREAFHKLLEQNYDMIYQIAYRFTGHIEESEDITQDVCIKLASKILNYRAEAKFKTWLYSIVINACLDGYRKRDRQEAQLNAYLDFADQDRAVNHDNILKISWLYRQMATLKEPLKETAFLVLAENLNHADVGRILNCSESTISWRMHEIRNKLKAMVESVYE
jgi:RNA polymerase sigma-70 factor (ECF subfamily)